MVGKGQPPKDPEDKRQKVTVNLSPKEREAIEQARDKENPDARLGKYIRDVTLKHVNKTNKK